MRKTFWIVTVFSFAAAIFTALLFHCQRRGIYLTLAVTFGTTSYHLGMRLMVGWAYNTGMKNRADYTNRWYQPRPWERRWYQFLRVKTWKDKLPTYRPENFSNKKHSWEEIAQAMCQAELVHETNILFSFVPLAASIWFGAFYVFLVTSVCSAVFDLLFVMIQRYNRARVVGIVERQRWGK